MFRWIPMLACILALLSLPAAMLHAQSKEPWQLHYTKRTPSGKWAVTDEKGKRLLPGAFDSVSQNHLFIGVQKGKDWFVYNASLRQLTPKPVRSWFFYGEQLQVLEGNEVYWLKTTGQRNNRYDGVGRICGTVEQFHNAIEWLQRGDTLARIQIGKRMGGGMYYSQLGSTFLIADQAYDSLRFVDGGTKFYYTENSVGNGTLTPLETLIAYRNGKAGLVSVDWQRLYTEWHSHKEAIQLIIPYINNQTAWAKALRDSSGRRVHVELKDTVLVAAPVYRRLTQILPPVYDSIQSDFNTYASPLYVWRDGLVGYYPVVKTPSYAWLGDRRGNFIRYRYPNGWKGWLDLRGVEYPDR